MPSAQSAGWLLNSRQAIKQRFIFRHTPSMPPERDRKIYKQGMMFHPVKG